jgi:hypothetical protein
MRRTALALGRWWRRVMRTERRRANERMKGKEKGKRKRAKQKKTKKKKQTNERIVWRSLPSLTQ